MATTTGFVQRLTLLQSARIACAWIGSSATTTELLTIIIPSDSSDADALAKSSMISVLADAQVCGREVSVVHADSSAAIDQVYFPQVDDTAPVLVDAIEATQAIQDLANSIPLIAGKRTVVRVYLSHPSSPGVTVRGELSVRSGPGDVPFVVPSENTVTLNPADAGDLPTMRQDVDRSLNFVLPATPEGPLGMELTRVTNSVTNTDIAFSGARRPGLWFHASAPLRLRVIGFRYEQDGFGQVPTPLDFALLRSWLGRAYPAGHVTMTTIVVDADAAPPFGCGSINTQLAAIRALDMDSGGDERTHYYGLVGDGGFFMRGCAAGIPSTPSPDVVASGPAGPATWGWDTDGSYGDWYGAHELGHTYGRRHPGFCGETMSDLDNYPFENGQLANGDSSFVGFDVGDPVNGLVMRALPGTIWHDVMTYCDRQWLSAYTYLGIRRRLADEDLLGPTGAAGPVMGGLAGAGVTGGRPDARFPHITPPSAPAEPAPTTRAVDGGGPGRATLSVVGAVNLTRASGEIRYLMPLEHARGPRSSGDDALLRARDAAGNVLDEFPVEVRLDSELDVGDDRHGIVDAVIQIDPRTQAIELVVGDQIVDRRVVGGGVRQIRALRVDSGDRGLHVTGEADEAASDSGVTYSVQFSTDEGATWQTLSVGRPTPSVDIDETLFAPDEIVQVRVIASDGLDRSVVTTDTFRAGR